MSVGSHSTTADLAINGRMVTAVDILGASILVFSRHFDDETNLRLAVRFGVISGMERDRLIASRFVRAIRSLHSNFSVISVANETISLSVGPRFLEFVGAGGETGSD